MKIEDLKRDCGDNQWNEKLRNTAAEVLETRKNRLPEIQNRKEQLESFAIRCNEQLCLMKRQFDAAKKNENCDSFTTPFCDEKIKCIDDILQSLDAYDKKLEELAVRFEHPKIRISSVGEKSVGKSTFIAKLLGLDDNDPIVMTKARDETADYTGTVNVLHHKNQDKEVINVILYSKNELLAIVNDYIFKIRQFRGRENWTLPGGVYEIRNFEQLRQLCNNKENVHNCFEKLRTQDNGAAIVSESVLAVEKYFYSLRDNVINEVTYLSLYDDVQGDDVNKIKNLDDKRELAEYNFMQHENPKYMAVKNIDITMNMQNQGLFEQFDFVDTKGASVAAGLQANREMFDEIDYSDAVIVICRGQQSESTAFINGPLLEHVNMRKCKDKMFLVVNVDKGIDIDKYLETARFPNCFNEMQYYGRFVDDHDVQAADFIHLTVQHLLGSIAGVVQANDNNAMASLNKLASDIGTLFRDFFNKGWEQLNCIADINEDQLLIDKLGMMCREVMSKVKANDDTTDFSYNGVFSYSEYLRLVNEGNIDSIEKILFDGEPIVDMNSSSFYGVDEELKAVLNAHSSYFTDSSISYSTNVCGEYIDAICARWYRLITNALVYKLAEQQELSITQYKNELFAVLWKGFKLDRIFGSNLDIEKIQNSNNAFFVKLAKAYGFHYHGQEINIEKFRFSSYAVMKEIFDRDGIMDEDSTDKINESIYIAIASLASEYKLDEMAYLHNMDAPNARRSFIQTILTIIDNDKVFAQDALPFYRQYRDIVLDAKDVKRINYSRDITDLLRGKETLAAMVKSENDFKF